MLEAIQDRRVRDKIRDRIDGLAEEPEKQGKPLTGELTGYRSLATWGNGTGSFTGLKKARSLSS